MKRRDQHTASSSSDTSAPESKKRKLAFATYEKWKTDLDRECQTVSWLDCDTEMNGRKKEVTKLQCTVCTKFKKKLQLKVAFGC